MDLGTKAEKKYGTEERSFPLKLNFKPTSGY